MKRPKKPYQPDRPHAPKKTFSQQNSIPLEKYCSLELIMSKVPDGLTFRDVSINVDAYIDYGYDGPEAHGGVSLIYYTQIPNPNYATEIVKYRADAKKYKTEMAKQKPKLEAYEIEYKKYLEIERARIKVNREAYDKKQFAKLKKRCEQLEAKLAKK